MNEPARKLTFTFAEYLVQERAGDTKHELINGEIYDMAGGTGEHARLASNMTGVLLGQLQGKPCAVFSSDLLVRVLATGMATYPDLSVICGRFEHDPEDKNVATNPIILVEVLSDGTESKDRGEKFAHYRRIPSLMEYVLVSQHEQRIEVFRRTEQGWILSEATAGESVKLISIDGELSVDAVYANPLEG
jgi:Uma2 family endonuclease